MTLDEARALVASVRHWHHTFEIQPSLVTPGTYDPAFLLDKMRLAADLRGLRMLDIGASDGFFALQFARRGAEVVAIDYRGMQDHGYHVMEQPDNNHGIYVRRDSPRADARAAWSWAGAHDLAANCLPIRLAELPVGFTLSDVGSGASGPN
jgi:hypothetical protein